MARMIAAGVDEVPKGGNKRVTLKGRPIVIFNQGSEFFALLDKCPHEGASLCMGLRIGVSRSSTVGVFEHSRAGEMVRCPWHGWEFDIRTGQSYCDPSKVRVRTFEVAVMDGAALAEGPYVAETFPVSVENEYIVIDV
jgi:3-phenylpropionate/trans-cinnamate dioxygenase ferredoxin subunit